MRGSNLIYVSTGEGEARRTPRLSLDLPEVTLRNCRTWRSHTNTLDATTEGTPTTYMHASTVSLSHTVCPDRISCERLGLGHSYLSNVLGWNPKKTSLLI